MATSQISETQYVMGFLSEYFNRIRGHGFSPQFLLPTTAQEPILGADFVIKGFTGFDFFQFKRSDYFGRQRGDAEIRAGVPKSFRPYYRFGLYNRGKFPQFDRLRKISLSSPYFRTFYCAPAFHTHSEFHHAFYSNQILNLSAIINCGQFNSSGFFPPNFDINDGNKHYIVFNRRDKTGYICSKAIDIKLTKEIEMNQEILNEKNFNKMVDDLYFDLIETDPIFRQSISSNLNNEDSRFNESVKKLFQTTSFLATEYNIHTLIR